MPFLSQITRTRSSTASIMSRVLRMNEIDRTTKTRSEGKENPRAINSKARFTKCFLWQYRCNFLCDALARTHARPLHAMRLRGGNQPSAPHQPHHERAQESHATLLSRLPSGGRHHAVDLLLSFEWLSVFKASSYYAHIRLHYHRASSPRYIMFPDRDTACDAWVRLLYASLSEKLMVDGKKNPVEFWNWNRWKTILERRSHTYFHRIYEIALYSICM